MSKPSRVGLIGLCLLFVACGSQPQTPPATVVSLPATPTAAVAVAPPSAGAPAAAPEGSAVEEAIDGGELGPVPVTAADPHWGRNDAPVTIVEFADFQCPFSLRVQGTLRQLEDKYGPDTLRIVWKNNPLPFHPAARPAADVAMALFKTRGNDAFWKLHAEFYADQQHLAELTEDAAARFGLNDPRVRQLGQEKVAADLTLAKEIYATGTPMFRINGVGFSGAQPLDKFSEVIDEQIPKARALVASGTPPRRVYVELTKAQFKAAPPPAPAVKEDLAIHKVAIGKSPVRGKATALVTIVEFADFQCPFSGRVAPTLKQVQQLYGDKVRLVYKHNPLPFHPRAEPAAELALEARAEKGDDAFWQAYDALFGNQQHLEDQDLLAIASSLHLDAGKVQKAIATHKYKLEIDGDQDLADDLEAMGTPHFFINGRRLVGAQPIEKFKAVIDEEIGKAQAVVQAGTPAAKVYDKLQSTAVAPAEPEKRVVAAPTKANPSRGPANAKITIQFFGDFQCPFTRRAVDTIKVLEQDFPGKIRVVWRNTPLPMHKDAPLAAEAAMEAFRQKGAPGFWAMFDLLFASAPQPGGLERPALDGMASQLGLDMTKFAAALDGRAHQKEVADDQKVAEAAKITGTPAFSINGYFIPGAQPIAKFKKIIQRALAEAK